MAGKYRTHHFTSLNLGTIQEFDFPGFGDIAGITFKWSLATSPGTNRDDMGMGMGAVSFAGSGFQWACSSFSEDAVDPSQCSSLGTTAAAIQISDDTGTGVDITGVVTSTSTGFRITWSSTPTTNWHIEAKIFGGDTMQCEAGVNTDSGAVDNVLTTVLTDMTIEPEVVLFASAHGNAFSPTPTSDAFFSLGFGNSALEQGGWGYADEDGRAGSNRHGHRLSISRVLEVPNWAASGTPLVSLEFTDTGVNGTPRGTFETTKRGTGVTVVFGYFAFSTAGVQSSKIEAVLIDTNTSGDKSYTGAGFACATVTILHTNLPSLGGNNGNNAGGGPGSADIDDKTLSEGSYSAGSRESDPSNSYSLFSQTLVEQRANIGNPSYTLDFDAFTWDGFDYSVSDASSVDKYSIILSLEEEPWGLLFWENLCLENDHTRTVQEIADSKIWSALLATSIENQVHFAYFGGLIAPVSGPPSSTRTELALLGEDFDINIQDENWNGAWLAMSKIREWTE